MTKCDICVRVSSAVYSQVVTVRLMALHCISTEGYIGYATAQSTVHFKQRGAAGSPITLTLFMLQARTRYILSINVLSPNHIC